MASRMLLWWIIGAFVVENTWGSPVSEGLPLGLVSDLTSRLGPGARGASRLQEPRLALPSSQDLEAIKKVAQILVMLGQQVIPAILGEPQTYQVPDEAAPAAEDIHSDGDGGNIDKQPVTSI